MTTQIAATQQRNDWRRAGILLALLLAVLVGSCVALVSDAESDNAKSEVVSDDGHADDGHADEASPTTAAPTTAAPTTEPRATPDPTPPPSAPSAIDGGSIELAFGDDGTLVVSGLVPSAAVGNRVLAAAAAAYADRTIVDELGIDGDLAADRLTVALSGDAPTTRKAVQNVFDSQAIQDAYFGGIEGEATTVDNQTFGNNTKNEQLFEDSLNELAIAEPITFATGSAEITASGRATLDKAVALFSSSEPVPVLIEGHTDDSGSDDANLALSQARADAVRNYLIDNGVDAGLLTATGFGESRPAVPNDSPENRAVNRRIAFQVNPE